MSTCPSPEEMAAFQVGRADPDLARRIRDHVQDCAICRALLARSSADPGSTLPPFSAWDAPQERPTAQAGPAPDVTLPVIPGCRLLREVGRGAQGAVYEAVQDSPQRSVAVKILYDAHRSSSMRRRFEREVDLVAGLRHPNIISVLSAGALPDGRLYCMMEFVPGVPLTEYVHARQLTLRQVLGLFADVCDGIQHAHQHGVIHRDLKPGNILVDADGVPRVLDFGLAKQVAAAADQTVISLTGQHPFGTLPYMAPEQASGDLALVDTRTDVYALGVVLYELLTGTYPYPLNGPPQLVLAHICQTPAARLARSWRPERGVSGPSRADGAADCPIDADLETIVLRALEKERERRYQSAGDLARDLRHYLAGEPVEARRDSAWYVLRKTVKRYRSALFTALAFLVVLGVGAIVTTGLWLDAARQHARAERALRETEDALQVSDCMGGRMPLEFGGVAERVANIQALRTFAARHPGNTQLGTVAATLAQEQERLHALLRQALDRNHLAPVLALHAEDQGDPPFEQILRELDADPRYAGVREAWRLRLHYWLRFPAPHGLGQEMHDALNMLRCLAPDDPRVAEADRTLRAWRDAARVVYEESFDQYEPGPVPPAADWRGNYGIEGLEIQGDRRGLHVTSTRSSTGIGVHPLHLDAPAITCTARLLVQCGADDPRETAASIHLSGAEGVLGEFGIDGGRFFLPGELAPGGRRGRVWGMPVEIGRAYEVEIRADRVQGTYDVLVDGDYLVESALATDRGPLEALRAGTGRATQILLDDLVCRAPDRPFRSELGPYWPIPSIETLRLELAGRIPLAVNSFLAADLNRDGIVELIGADAREYGALHFLELRGPDFVAQRMHTERFATNSVLTVGAVDGLLWVLPFAGDMLDEMVALFRVAGDFRLEEVYRRGYSHAEGGPGLQGVAPVHFGDGRDGLVAWLSCYGRGFELLARSGPDAAEAYRPLGHYTPHKPGGLPSDVRSIVACDWDGDGDDELFLGWAYWHGYCPALVTLEWDRAPDGAPALGAVQALTDEVGATTLALSHLGDSAAYLIAVSRQLPTRHGHTSGAGVRVWRVPDIRADGPTPPSYYLPCQAEHVATGTLAGRDVFATCAMEQHNREERSDAVLRVHAREGDKIVVRWEATLHGCNEIYDLAITDANGDGAGELLVALASGDLLILAPVADDALAGMP